MPALKRLLVLKQTNMKNKRENDKRLNTQPMAQGIKNSIAKAILKMLSAYNQNDSFVPIKSDTMTCVQPLYFIPRCPS